MRVTLAIVFAIAIVCVIGFFKGLDEKKSKQEEQEITKPVNNDKPRDPKTGRYIKRS